MSHSILRRRRLRSIATAAALTLGSLALPAAALADGQLDPAFNGTGYHLGTVAEGTVFNNVDTRVPMINQGNNIVIGGSRGGFMTLARYTADRRPRPDVRRRRLRHRSVLPARPRAARATAAPPP